MSSRSSRQRRASVGAALATLALALLLLGPSSGSAAAPRPGAEALHVSVLSCVTGNSRVAARGRCRAIPGAGYESSQSSGLDLVTALGRAGSGASLYAVGERNSTLAQLSLEPARRLSFVTCLTGDTFLDTCAHLPGATANAPEAPLSYPTGVAVSPDGRSLYAVSGSFHGSVVARFVRDPATGALAYGGCLTGDLGAGPTGPAGCAALPGATREGFGSGLYEPSGVVVSRDGHRVYVTAAGDGSVAAFDRDPASGALSLVRCVSSNRQAAGCVRTPGRNDVLEGLEAPILSPDGRYLYAGASRKGTVSAFALGGAGAIRFAGCVSGDEEQRPCKGPHGPRDPANALLDPGGLAGSPDGRYLYAGSTYGTIVTPVTPRRTKGTHHASLLTGVRAPLVFGNTLLAPIRTIDGLAELRRNAKTGALAFRACATGNLALSTARGGPCSPLPGATRDGTSSGFYKTTALLPAPGGLLYAAASGDATVSLLRRR